MALTRFFQITLVILGALIVILLSLDRYIEIKKHNLSLINRMLSACSKEGLENGAETCLKLFQREYIPHWKNPLDKK